MILIFYLFKKIMKIWNVNNKNIYELAFFVDLKLVRLESKLWNF